MRLFRGLVLTTLVVVLLHGGAGQAQPGTAPWVQFVFTSDAHYGLTRDTFRGGHAVSAHLVNAAMVSRINALPAAKFPTDGGLGAGQAIGAFDFLVEGGDVANREEDGPDGAIQRAAASWAEFRTDYLEGVTLTDRAGHRSPVFVVPGNHDASNAVGFYKPMTPAVDKTAMAQIYNLMMQPAVVRTATTYQYATDKVLTSRDIGGLHFLFFTVWLDSTGRRWLDQDLARVPATVPAILFTHDQPDVESKHFQNPNGAHDVNATDKFENLLSDPLADGTAITAPSLIEQRRLEAAVARHPNLSAYFHGDSNWNQFYEWTGPDHALALHTFRVDSPMKGAISSKDETALSFQVVTIDPTARTMTVRECLWNAVPTDPAGPVHWGGSVTVALSPRPAAKYVRLAGALLGPARPQK